MPFDALTLAAVRDELEPLLTGSRVQKLVMVDELSVALECFAPGQGRVHLLISSDLERGRVQRIGQLPARGIERDTPFSLTIRKHLRSARIRSVHQPRLERVFEMHCEQRDASDRQYRVVLILEAMGRRSNLVLVDGDGVIMDAARRTPPSRSHRPVLPHLPYVAPPPQQDRLWPEELSGNLPSDPKLLAQRVAGLSPLAAREIVFRAQGRDLLEVTREFLSDRHAWSPCVAFDDDGPLDYAPYTLTHLFSRARVEPYPTISSAMDAYYAQARTAPRGDALAGERKALLALLERSEHSTGRRIAALEHQLSTGSANRDPLRRAGDLLLAYQTEIEPQATEVTLEGEDIALDRELSAVENAQEYYAKYRRARETEARVPELLEAAQQQRDHLLNLRTMVELARDMGSIRALRREIAAATGSAAREGKSSKKSSPYERIALGDGWEALVGTSATGNANVTFDVARGEDLWLHARGVPGAHVILRGPAADPPPDVLERAAQLAAAHSAARTAGAVEVDVTPRRYVKKVPQGPPGLVRYSNERTVRVSPRAS